MKIIRVKRSIVAEILDRVRCDLADHVPAEEIERRLACEDGAYRISGAPVIEPIEKCLHEGGAYTDNCMACAPRWGHAGSKVECS
jgi:hypothetical protein